MTLVSVITNDGKNTLLNVGFGLGADPFTKLAVGVGEVAPEKTSIALNSECTVADHGSYTRVTLVNTPDEDNFIMKSEGTFLTTNITEAGTVIKEIGIVNTDVLEEGIFWCICQVEDTPKDSTKQVKFTIYSTMNECCPG